MSAVALLTINEVSELESVHRTSVLRYIKSGKIQAVQAETNAGRRGYEYRINLDQLSEKALRKYYARQKEQEAALAASMVALDADGADTVEGTASPSSSAARKDNLENLSLTELTEAQRTDITFWLDIIKEYNLYISEHYKNTTKATKDFIEILKERYPNKSISERTLRRKIKDYRDMGDIGLTDLRLQNKLKGATVVDGIVWSAFLQYWLDEARPSTTACYRLVNDFLRLEGRKNPALMELLPLPDVSAVYRQIKRIPYPVLQFYRYGNKAYCDDCEPYLERDYENLDSNEVWSADYHTLDFFVKCDVSGDVYRPYLLAWMDVRSRKIVGIALTKSANSDGVVMAFRKAIMRHGVPQIFYGDNGREFLTSDFGGRGRRKTDSRANYGKTILDRLGIAMHNSQVANAKAKAIERFFGEICNNFSKFVTTYAGGKPADRPERLGGILKDGGKADGDSNRGSSSSNANKIPMLSEATQWIESYIEGYYNNQPSNARGLKGMTPNQCWEQKLIIKKTATQDQLDLLMLRSVRLQEVKRNGVYLTIGGEKVWFYDTELVTTYMKHKVYVRYNPEDLSIVHVYDEQERYICEAAIVAKGDYSFGGGDNDKTTEAIKELNRKKKQQKKVVKDYMAQQENLIKVRPAMEVLEAVSLERLANHQEPDAQILQHLGWGQQKEVDIARMAENAAKKKMPKGRK